MSSPRCAHRRTSLARQVLLVALLACLAAGLVLATDTQAQEAAHPEGTPAAAAAAYQEPIVVAAPSSEPDSTTNPLHDEVRHQDPYSEAQHRAQERYEHEQWQRLESLARQAREEEALATAQDVMAKLSQGSDSDHRARHTTFASLPSSMFDTHATTSEHAESQGTDGTTAPVSPLVQSAYYYHAMEALHQQGNVSLFAERLREGVEATGHGRMHYLLGVLYANGVAVPQSEANAVLHFSFAALQGVPEAHLALAHRLEMTGTNPNDSPLDRCAAALPHYHEAADAVALTFDGVSDLSLHGPLSGAAREPSSRDGAHTDDADGIRLMEGSTPRAEALTTLKHKQLVMLHNIVASDSGSAHASLMLGLHHLRGEESTGARNWQHAQRYLHKAIAQSPSFIELYLQKNTHDTVMARTTLDPPLSPIQTELLSFMLYDTMVGKVAASYGFNPTLPPTATSSTAEAASPSSPSWRMPPEPKTTMVKNKRVTQSGEALPEADDARVLQAINVAGMAYGLLGQMHATGNVLSDERIPRDFAKALRYFRHGVALGDCASLNGLGFLHAIGYLHDGRTDEENAVYEAVLAATPGASRPFSRAPLTGSDFISAEHYFRTGTTQRTCASCAYNLGVLHLHGLDGLAQHPPTPLPNSPRSSTLPFAGHRAEEGLFLPSRDTVEKAAKLFQTAAAEGSVLALWQLGRLAEREGNCRAALALFRRVAAFGSWMHGDETAAPWSFALMEDWRDKARQAPPPTATHTGAKPTRDSQEGGKATPAPPQYGNLLARRTQSRHEHHERLLAYQRAFQEAAGQDREAFLRVLRQHAAGSQPGDTAPLPPSPARGARNGAAETGAARLTASSMAGADGPDGPSWPKRVVRRLLRRISDSARAWRRRRTATKPAQTTPQDAVEALRRARQGIRTVVEPVSEESVAKFSSDMTAEALDALVREHAAVLQDSLRPMTSPLVDLIEGLALIETGFVDYFAAWRAVELLEDGVQVVEEVFDPLLLADSEKAHAGAQDTDATRRLTGTAAQTASLVRAGWLDAEDLRFSAHDEVPAGAADLLDDHTVLLQWRAPFDSSSSSSSSQHAPPQTSPQRLVSQCEAKKLLLHSLLQRYAHAASNRIPDEAKYTPSRTGTRPLRAPFAPRLGQTLPATLNRLGDFYYKGESKLLGVDFTLALQHYREAAALGHSQAAFNAGVMLQFGLGNFAEESGEARRRGDPSASPPPTSSAMSPRAATAQVAAHPVVRVLSLAPSLPLVGTHLRGWFARLEEALATALTLPPDVALRHDEGITLLYEPPGLDGWPDSSTYLFLHGIHLFLRNPALVKRCDLHLAKRYYDTTVTLNPRARWASRIMLWTLRWQSWLLGIPYEGASAEKKLGGTAAPKVMTSPPPSRQEDIENTGHDSLSEDAETIGFKEVVQRVRAKLNEWMYAYVMWVDDHLPTYRTVEDVVLYAALATMAAMLYLILR